MIAQVKIRMVCFNCFLLIFEKKCSWWESSTSDEFFEVDTEDEEEGLTNQGQYFSFHDNISNNRLIDFFCLN